jgi:hypothetical protein|tara:strand:- start:549 stop:866 length:318 start_codon:yes stop_codon:yes gene_type:complete
MATTSFVITTVKKVGGFIYDDVEDKEEAEKKIKYALDEGHKITFKGGREQWQMDEAITPDFIWDETGNKVKCRRILYTRQEDGVLTKKVLKELFISYVKIFGEGE